MNKRTSMATLVFNKDFKKRKEVNNMNKRTSMVTLIFILLLTILTYSPNAIAKEEHGGLPSLFSATSYGTASQGYAEVGAIGAALRREYNVTMRLIPGGTGIARVAPLRGKTADFGFLGSEASLAAEGLDVFASKDWGPQQLQQVWVSFAPFGITWGVTKTSGIKVPADLKGKRVSWIIGGAALNRLKTAFLHFADLSIDDVKLVKVSSYEAEIDTLKEGRADACLANTTNSNFEETLVSPYGFRYVEFPHDDKAGYERVFSILPWAYKIVVTKSIGNQFTEKNPGQVFNTAFPVLTTRGDLDPGYIYAMTKAIHKTYPEYKDITWFAVGWHIDNFKKNMTSIPIPYHDGAVRYYKEIGIWTEAAETHHKRMLYRNKLLRDTWNEAIKAQGKRLDGREWEEFWMEKRSEALKKAGLPTYDVPAKLVVKE